MVSKTTISKTAGEHENDNFKQLKKKILGVTQSDSIETTPVKVVSCVSKNRGGLHPENRLRQIGGNFNL